MYRQILHGDVLEKFKEIPDESIDTIITSPPYYKLRTYEADGEIGQEDSIHDYIDNLMAVMTECKRALKQAGTCWININDTYEGRSGRKSEVRQRSLMGIPERFYIRCIDDGWTMHNHIPWVKKKSLPFSGKRRFQNKWEHIFYMSKSGDPDVDLDAVRTPHKENRKSATSTANIKGLSVPGQSVQTVKRVKDRQYHPNGKNPGDIMEFSTADTLTKCRHCDWNSANIKVHIVNDSDVRYCVTCGKSDLLDHHATFPWQLPHYILKFACPKDGIVLDPFMGSGSTAEAAEKLGLRWCGIEINADSILYARKRLAKYLNGRII